jgi:hypothetical protein
VVLALGTGQTIAYASSWYLPAMYLPAILAAPVAGALHLPAWAMFAGLSGAIVIDGLVGPWAGRLVDRGGARPVLAVSARRGC